jgi:restriction system protein
LKALGGSARPAEVTDRVAADLSVSDEEQSALTSSGVPRFYIQVAWARFYLAKAGMIDASRRGVWTLTETGRAADPMDHSEALLALSPTGFEAFSQRVLRESGFQGVTVTGRSGDGGIDGVGILEVNPLVSFKVLFQCKRYAGSVSSGAVRDFRGAMMGRADKGIILTTGTFTSDARKEAVRDGVTPIELVDGEKLVDMLETLELGLEPVRAYRVDAAFFAEFA